jgi:hypothetical protein
VLPVDERMQSRDRRFFIKNRKRRTYARFASDTEETAYRHLAGIPMEEQGACVMLVRLVAKGMRIRQPLLIPMTEPLELVLPKGEANCAAIFNDIGVFITFEDGKAVMNPPPETTNAGQ